MATYPWFSNNMGGTVFKTFHTAAGAFVAALFIALGSAGTASATTYVFTGPTYAGTAVSAPACTVGPCANYTGTMRVTGSFTTSAPLSGGLVNANVYGQITAYSFTDGINTYTKPAGASGNNRLVTLRVSTDGSGNIIAASTTFDVYLWLSADHTTTGRISFIGGNLNAPRHNFTCGAVGTGADGNTDDCVLPTADFANGSYASPGQGVWTTVPEITSLNPASGAAAGGTVVQINGFGFTGTTGAASVMFGTNNATSYTVDSNTLITAIAPAGSGSVRVKVVNNSQTSLDTASDDFTYLAAPVPTLSEWAMILFGTILAGGAALYTERRKLFV